MPLPLTALLATARSRFDPWLRMVACDEDGRHWHQTTLSDGTRVAFAADWDRGRLLQRQDDPPGIDWAPTDDLVGDFAPWADPRPLAALDWRPLKPMAEDDGWPPPVPPPGHLAAFAAALERLSC